MTHEVYHWTSVVGYEDRPMEHPHEPLPPLPTVQRRGVEAKFRRFLKRQRHNQPNTSVRVTK